MSSIDSNLDDNKNKLNNLSNKSISDNYSNKKNEDDKLLSNLVMKINLKI